MQIFILHQLYDVLKVCLRDAFQKKIAQNEICSMGISVLPDFRPPGSDFRSIGSGLRPLGSETRPPETKIRPQGSEIRPPILRNSDMTSMPKIQTDITDYASEILFLKYCVVSELFKIMSYLANFGGLISDPLGLILDP